MKLSLAWPTTPGSPKTESALLMNHSQLQLSCLNDTFVVEMRKCTWLKKVVLTPR